MALLAALVSCGSKGGNVPVDTGPDVPGADLQDASQDVAQTADQTTQTDLTVETTATDVAPDSIASDLQDAGTPTDVVDAFDAGGEVEDAGSEVANDAWLLPDDGSGAQDTALPDLGQEECTPEKCGVACTDPAVCGDCGNGVCDGGESEDDCPVDCCNPQLCAPGGGPEFISVTQLCQGVADGTPCSDGKVDNGFETCQDSICRYESPHCRCAVASDLLEPEVDASEGEPPALVELPEWTGAPVEDDLFADAWAFTRMGVDQAWAITQGVPEVVVAIIDTGCSADSPDLSGQVVASWDVVEQTDSVVDVNGHGSLLASLVAAKADGQGAVGIAPGVKLLCIKAASDEGIANYQDLAVGLDWAVAQGADIALFGTGGYGVGEGLAQLRESTAAAAAADVVVVAPAGSSGPSNLDAYPAGFSEHVVSVGASLLSDMPSADAGISPSTWLLAPGQGVVGTEADGTAAMQDGSSVAAALVAGVAALVRSADEKLPAVAVRGVLHGQGRTVPLDQFERLFAARLVHAGAAVTAASEGHQDLSVQGLEIGGGRVLPSAVVTAHVVVENRGAGQVGPSTVEISADGAVLGLAGQVPEAAVLQLPVAALGPGQSQRLAFSLAATGEKAQVIAVAVLDCAEDQDDGNNQTEVTVDVIPDVIHSTRIRDARIAPADQGELVLAVLATLENVGTVPEPVGTFRALVWPAGNEVEQPVPSLAPGETAALQFTVEPGECDAVGRCQLDLYLEPAPGQTETQHSFAILRFRYDPEDSTAEQAYMQLPGDNLIADAPWRTVLGKIPVLFFYARTNWIIPIVSGAPIGPQAPFRMGYVRVRNPDGPKSGQGPIVYEDHHNKAPTTIPAGAYSVNEFGTQIVGSDVVWTAKPPDGSHRILWLPTVQLPNNSVGGMVDPAATGAFLEVEFRYKTALIQLWYSDRTRRMLGVEIGNETMPKFASEDHYFDPHYHSIAEWYRGHDPLGPAKAYGGPLWMTSAAAASIGMLDSPDLNQAQEKIITTDHNAFFNDDDAPEAGPTMKSLWTTNTLTNSFEFDLYRNKLGSTAGEEVTVQGGAMSSVLGRHVLTYRARHVDGKWGWVKGLLPTPPVDEFLRRMACNPGEVGTPDGPGKNETCLGGTPDNVVGFAFAAHPFSNMFLWDDDVLRKALSLPPHNNSEFLTGKNEFVFKGYQFLNTRPAQVVTSSLFTLGYRDFNPYVGATHDSWWKSWKTWTPNCVGPDGYRTSWQEGMTTFLNQVRDGLDLTISDAEKPRDRYFRKMYHLAGSDAHGDFGYGTDICSSVLVKVCHTFGMNSITDSAFGRPRTYVYGGTIEQMRRGQTVSTDGPIVEVEFDPEARATYDKETGVVTWHEGSESFEDSDGQVGGAGVRDGERSAFVPLVLGYKEAQRFRVRTRCKNIDAFGGSSPTTFELLVTGEAGSGADPKAISLLPEAKCDGQWQDQTVYLGATAGNPEGMLTGPVAFLAHATVGSGCPGTYESYTNPIWVSTVSTYIPLEASEQPTGSFKLKQESDVFPVVFNFRQSMLTQELVVRVKAIDKTTGALVDLGGGADGQGGLQPVPAATFGWEGVPPDFDPPVVRNLKLTYAIPSGKPITGPLSTSINQQEFVLVVTRKLVDSGLDNCNDARLCDSFGNPLGVLAVKFKPTATCSPKSCGLGFKWCESQCNCQLAWECPAGTMDFGGCECCWSWDCFPLPCSCSFCASKEDVFWMTCPGG